VYRGTSLIRNSPPLGPYRRPKPMVPGASHGGWRFLMGEVPLYATTFSRRRFLRARRFVWPSCKLLFHHISTTSLADIYCCRQTTSSAGPLSASASARNPFWTCTTTYSLTHYTSVPPARIYSHACTTSVLPKPAVAPAYSLLLNSPNPRATLREKEAHLQELVRGFFDGSSAGLLLPPQATHAPSFTPVDMYDNENKCNNRTNATVSLRVVREFCDAWRANPSRCAGARSLGQRGAIAREEDSAYQHRPSPNIPLCTGVAPNIRSHIARREVLGPEA